MLEVQTRRECGVERDRPKRVLHGARDARDDVDGPRKSSRRVQNTEGIQTMQQGMGSGL